MKLWTRVLLLAMSILLGAWVIFVTLSLTRLTHIAENIRAEVSSVKADTSEISDVKSAVDDIKAVTDQIKTWVVGPTALCSDGTFSFAAQHQGACSQHGGVAVWYK